MVVSYYCPVVDSKNKKNYCIYSAQCLYPSVNYHDTVNYSEVDFEGVESVVISCDDEGQLKIIQANGYTEDRGTFCDMY